MGCREVVSRWAGVRVGRRGPVSRARGCRRRALGTLRSERLCARWRQRGGDKGFLDKSQVSDRAQNVLQGIVRELVYQTAGERECMRTCHHVATTAVTILAIGRRLLSPWTPGVVHGLRRGGRNGWNEGGRYTVCPRCCCRS